MWYLRGGSDSVLCCYCTPSRPSSPSWDPRTLVPSLSTPPLLPTRLCNLQAEFSNLASPPECSRIPQSTRWPSGMCRPHLRGKWSGLRIDPWPCTSTPVPPPHYICRQPETLRFTASTAAIHLPCSCGNPTPQT